MSIKTCKEHKRDKNKEEDTNNNKINPVCEALGMETTEKWHTHTHITHYVNMEMLTVLYQAAHTDREVTANRPNMTIKNKKEKICIMIEVEILAGRESHAKGSRKRS